MRKQPYKSTQTVTIKDVPKVYADIFNLMISAMMQLGHKTKAEAFQEMIDRDAINYLGHNEAERAMKQMRETEALREQLVLDQMDGIK